MKQYSIHKIKNDRQLETLPVLKIDVPYADTPQDVCAFAQIGWDEDGLLVRMWAKEPDIRAEDVRPLGMPCQDSCLEFFFCPMEGDPRYFNIEFNFNRCMFVGFGTDVAHLTRLAPQDELLQPWTGKTPEGWELRYRIPFAFIQRFFPGFQAEPGKRIRANCYACSDLKTPPHYLSWNPLDGPPLSFHRSECFGIMQFAL